MSNDWETSASAWIDWVGDRGDWARKNVLDAALLGRIHGRKFVNALDVGCGEGRFCRRMQQEGIKTIGLDPTTALLSEARRRDPNGEYCIGQAEALPFNDGAFDLVVTCLSLVDIADYLTAISEMTRTLSCGGTLLIANLTSFMSSGMDHGWVYADDGTRMHYPVDNYLDETAHRVEWSAITVKNWHRPLSAYMSALLDNGLILRHFDEPEPVGGTLEDIANYRRVPWFVVMEWSRP